MSEKIFAGFINGKCRLATRLNPADKSFIQKCVDRGADVRLVTIEEAIAASDPGFQKCLRMLRKSIRNEVALRPLAEVANAARRERRPRGGARGASRGTAP